MNFNQMLMMQCSKSAPLENSAQVVMDASIMGYQLDQEADIQSEVIGVRNQPTIKVQIND